jgi:hypothetical protein
LGLVIVISDHSPAAWPDLERGRRQLRVEPWHFASPRPSPWSSAARLTLNRGSFDWKQSRRSRLISRGLNIC